MTLRHLKIFVSVFCHSSITKASSELHLAQPSVSVAIRELEDYYGVRLFDRLGRRIVPTEEGKVFYGYASHILSAFDEMETQVRNSDRLGILRVGASITIGTCLLPELVKRCQAKLPGLRIVVSVCNSAEVETAVLTNQVDVGLIETNPSSDDFTALPFMEDSLCAIAAPGHPLAGEKPVTLSDLAQYPFLMREKGSAGREILDAAFALQGLSVQPVWESASTGAIVQAVAQGLGVAVLPLMLVQRDLHSGLVVALPLRPQICRTLHILYHKNKFLTGSLQTFIHLCQGLDGTSSTNG